jgi:hypothetical protein
MLRRPALAFLAATCSLWAAVASAEAAVVVNESEPFTIFEISCTGERLVIEGRRHLLVHATDDRAGGVHFATHFAIHGQVTTESGAKYVVNTGGNDNVTVAAGGAITQTVTVRTVTMRAGEEAPADDLFFHVVLHATANANGEITSDFWRTRFDCH